MVDVSKFMKVDVSSLSKAYKSEKSNIAKIFGIDMPSGARGIFGGGAQTTGGVNTMEYITITSLGNTSDFGDLSGTFNTMGACSNGPNGGRGLFGGGVAPEPINWLNLIEYITISSLGNTSDFGDLTVARYALASVDNGTNDRGVWGGGVSEVDSYENTMDYVTISSTGNASNFGDLTEGKRYFDAVSNATNNRGVFGGGYTGAASINVLEYVSISVGGNTSDFGDLAVDHYGGAAHDSGTNDRGIFVGGWSTDVGDYCNNIDYFTISSLGNASDFGDLTTDNYLASGTSNETGDRGIIGGGQESVSAATRHNIIDYVTISSTGNASSFGVLSAKRSGLSATSDA